MNQHQESSSTMSVANCPFENQRSEVGQCISVECEGERSIVVREKRRLDATQLSRKNRSGFGEETSSSGDVTFNEEVTEEEEVEGELDARQVRKKDLDVEDIDEKRLPDGGWGWMVVIGSSLSLVLVDTLGQCFGVLFARLFIQLETSTAMTAWIFNLFTFIWCMMGLPIGPLVKEFGWRLLAFVGALLLTIATISSAFVSAAWILFFTYSLLAGMGCGILSNVSYTIVPHYFEKRRGLANAILMAWDCGGQVIAPPIIEILQTEYTFSGATLILGGVILNCCVGASLLHPVEWHLKPKIKSNFRQGDSQIVCRQKASTDMDKNSSERISKVLSKLLISTVKNLTILKSLRAIILATSTACIMTGYLNFMTQVPFAMQEQGHSLADAAVCTSISAICNMMTRLITAALSDSKRFNFRIAVMLSSLTISGTMVGFTFINNLTAIKVLMGLWGCGVGSFMSIFNLVMVEYMGLENLMSMMGSSMLCIAFASLILGPAAGYMRDVSQSYAVCIWILAGVVFLAFVLWIFMPAAVNHDSRRQRLILERKRDTRGIENKNFEL